MSNNLRDQISSNMKLKETDELLNIWQTNDRVEWSNTAFDVVKELLLHRLGKLPPQNPPITRHTKPIKYSIERGNDMKMTKPIKVALGIFTFFTVVFPFFIMPAFILFFMSTSGFPFVHPYSTMNPESFDKSFPTILLVLYPAIMCFSLSQLALQVAYIVLAVKNKVLTDVYRILFIIGMFFMPYIAMPIYFVVYIWKEGAQIEGFQDSEINSGKSIKQIIVKTQKREDKTPKSSSVKNNISKTKKATAVKKSTRSKK